MDCDGCRCRTCRAPLHEGIAHAQSLAIRSGRRYRRGACRRRASQRKRPVAHGRAGARTPFARASSTCSSEQSPRGNWDEMAEYHGGVTALCTLALLNSGVEPTIPKIAEVARLPPRARSSTKTYTVALQTMVLCARPSRSRTCCSSRRNVQLARSRCRSTRATATGAWSYPLGAGVGGDNSNSQFAVLALYEAERVGAEVEPRNLAAAPPTTGQHVQNADGSWGYVPGVPGTGSMTCAGIGAWVICSRHSRRAGAPQSTTARVAVLPAAATTTTCSNAPSTGWAATSPSAATRARAAAGRSGTTTISTAWSASAGSSARRFIGDHDWYREGAEFLVSEQDPFCHYWKGSGYAEDNPHISTALALLFLSKGRRPVLMAKVKHGPSEDWNNHRSDVANLTAFTESSGASTSPGRSSTRRPPTVEDLLQAPVLFISGSKRPSSTASKQEAPRLRRPRRLHLRRSLLQRRHASSTTGFRQFIDRVFPEAEYKLRLAGPEHPIWRIDKLVRPDSPYVGRLWTIEYGCRTCVVFCRSRSLVLLGTARPRPTGRACPRPSKQRSTTPLAIGVNVLTYATNREPKGKEAVVRRRSTRPTSTPWPAAASSTSPSSATAAAATTPPARWSTCSAPPRRAS